MDREGLAKRLRALGLTQERSRAAVDALFDTLGDALRKGRSVSIVGFGKWDWKDRPAKAALDPRTGQTRSVPARRKVGFKPSEALKRSLNPRA